MNFNKYPIQLKDKRTVIILGIAGFLLVVGLILVSYSSLFAAKNGSPNGKNGATTPSFDKDVKVVTVDKVHSAAVDSSTTFPGVVHAFQTAKLSFRVGGPLHEIRVKPGDIVKTGDVLMQIDKRDFINDVETTQAKLEALKARYSAMKTGARAEDIQLMEASLESAKS
ncbi:MAG: biotin/lipoyl-binding protein, partial [Thermoguttaceae bacterium]